MALSRHKRSLISVAVSSAFGNISRISNEKSEAAVSGHSQTLPRQFLSVFTLDFDPKNTPQFILVAVCSGAVLPPGPGQNHLEWQYALQWQYALVPVKTTWSRVTEEIFRRYFISAIFPQVTAPTFRRFRPQKERRKKKEDRREKKDDKREKKEERRKKKKENRKTTEERCKKKED